MALLNLGDDPWLIEYESCNKLQMDIMEQLMVREKEPRSSEQYARLSANIRFRLKQFNNEVNQLKDKLNQLSKLSTITFEEAERRTRQVEVLKSKSVQMEKIFQNIHSTNKNQERNMLLGESSWNADDDLLEAGSSNLTVEDIKKQKEKLYKDQDAGLENLSKIIARQKNIAETITTEVDLQNDIIDDLGDHMERTDARIHGEIQNVAVIDRKDNTCIYWIVIVLLFLSIITVAAI